MQNYQNTDVVSRRWDRLIDLATERTLELGPGAVTTEGVAAWIPQLDAEGHVDRDKPLVEGPLPADFSDLYLKPVAAPALVPQSTKGATQTTTPAEAPAAAETKE